jgi:hypothetical protein
MQSDTNKDVKLSGKYEFPAQNARGTNILKEKDILNHRFLKRRNNIRSII